MRHDIPVELTNDSGETVDSSGDIALGLGTDVDVAFTRGRAARRKGRSFNGSLRSVKGKPLEYRQHFVNGWKWQDDRSRATP